MPEAGLDSEARGETERPGRGRAARGRGPRRASAILGWEAPRAARWLRSPG